MGRKGWQWLLRTVWTHWLFLLLNFNDTFLRERRKSVTISLSCVAWLRALYKSMPALSEDGGDSGGGDNELLCHLCPGHYCLN